MSNYILWITTFCNCFQDFSFNYIHARQLYEEQECSNSPADTWFIQKTLAIVHLRLSVVCSEAEACPSEEALNHIVWNFAQSDSVDVECKANTLRVKVWFRQKLDLLNVVHSFTHSSHSQPSQVHVNVCSLLSILRSDSFPLFSFFF